VTELKPFKSKRKALDVVPKVCPDADQRAAVYVWLNEEVIAPFIQNLVHDVQIHTKPFKSLSRHTNPCRGGANSYKSTPLPPRVPCHGGEEVRPVLNGFANTPLREEQTLPHPSANFASSSSSSLQYNDGAAEDVDDGAGDGDLGGADERRTASP
jgi:hypothetical protein